MGKTSLPCGFEGIDEGRKAVKRYLEACIALSFDVKNKIPLPFGRNTPRFNQRFVDFLKKIGYTVRGKEVKPWIKSKSADSLPNEEKQSG